MASAEPPGGAPTPGPSSSSPAPTAVANGFATPAPLPGGPGAPSIVAPSGGGAIRGIDEKFAANPATGAGTLSVTVPASAGRSGTGPTLTLAYDSSSANGPFGYGWHVDLPAITRKTSKGVPRYGAGPPDTFILSGFEDLVPTRRLLGRRVGGTDFEITRYRPRVEGMFARIERWTDLSTGDEHWRSITTDNITTVYGPDADSRISDPEEPSRVFSWLIACSHDDRGNVVEYGYAREDDTGVDLDQPGERYRRPGTRTANRYPKRIRYGNRSPRLVENGARGAPWMFELVFDYGDHDPDRPFPAADRPWTVRRDPFSTCRSGFEIRTYRLCQRILMFHHFPEEADVGADCVVRSLEIAYRGDPTQGEAPGSFLAAVRQCGWRRRGAGYLKRSLPPLDLAYTPDVIDPRVHVLDPDALANLPAGVDGITSRFVDLDAEGIPGVLTTDAGSWYYKANLGGERFASSRQLRNLPTVPDLATGGQLIDLDGDGRLDLVDFAGPVPGYSSRTDGGWSALRTIPSLPLLDWNDPNLRLVDLTGDGHPDILITQGRLFRWYPSLAAGGFEAARATFPAIDEDRGANVVFADGEQAVYLADMTGDGLSDLVRVRNGEVCYWPNYGYGRFGPKVAMAAAPYLDHPDQFDQRRVRLLDVDGSGTSDLLYLHRDEVRIHRNLSGNGYAPVQTIPLPFPDAGQAAAAVATDLLGKGTPCLVWSSVLAPDAGRQIRYIDLMSGGKPHLLCEIRNNLGTENHIHYTASTQFYLADKAAGRPWATRLPFPVQVVDQVDLVDRVSRNRFSTHYAYHHGYFDGVEREFHGFGMVEQVDTTSIGVLAPADAIAPNLDPATFSPPVLTRTWIHNGALAGHERISRLFAHEYYRESRHDPRADDELLLADTVLPEAAMTPDERRQAVRALKGHVLRTEVYALDGSDAEDRPYTVVERNYTVRMLQPSRGWSIDGADPPYAVFYVHDRETITAAYERARYPVGSDLRADPRVTHDLVLDVDDFGNVLRSAAIAYGRRHRQPEPFLTPRDHDEQARRHIVLTETSYTSPVELDDAYRRPMPCARQRHEIVGPTPDGERPGATAPFRFDELLVELAGVTREIPAQDWDTSGAHLSGRRLIDATRVLYRRDDLTGPLPSGSLESMALPYESYRLAFTSSLVTAQYGSRVDPAALAEGGYCLLDGAEGWWTPSGQVFFSPGPEDPSVEEAEYARAHFFVPLRFRDPFGAILRAQYDPYDLLVLQVRDAAGNLTTSGEHDEEGGITRNGNDYRVLQPASVMDPNRNRTQVSFDALGLVAGKALLGKPGEDAGDSLEGFEPDPEPVAVTTYFRAPTADPWALLQGATTRIVHDLFAYQRTETEADPRPPWVATLVREKHLSDSAGGEPGGVHQVFSYSDGSGREIQRKSLAETGPVDDDGPDVDPRWTASGWTVFNNKGSPVRKYEPFFSATHHFELAVLAGVSPVLFYDPLERAAATLTPNACWEKLVFDPWLHAAWDVNDTVLSDPATDPDIGGYVAGYLAEHPWVGWYEQRIDGELGPAEREAARRTAAHASTPALSVQDSAGRIFLTVAHNRSPLAPEADEFLVTRRVLDVEGQERASIDALGRTAIRYGYDLLGRKVRESSMEAGETHVLNDVLGRPIRSWTARGDRFRTRYDAARRPVAVYVSGAGEQAETLHERIEYGEDAPDGLAENLRGRSWRTFDQAGLATNHRFDFKGNLLTAGRRLVPGIHEILDWSADPIVEPDEYLTSSGFDALNRAIRHVTPDGSVLRATFNRADLVEHLDVDLRGHGQTSVILANATYNARGQHVRRDYGNGVVATYEHDPLTFRLTRLRTGRAGRPLQDLRYTYDPTGNITRLDDDAQPVAFFRNRRVTADSSYLYDALYRLVRADGREHLAYAGPPPVDDTPQHLRAHPHDGTALARYRERYVYDGVGNILRLEHRSAAPSESGWTRFYRYAQASQLEPGRFSNRLSGTASSADEPPEPLSYDEHGNLLGLPELPLLRWNVRDQLAASARAVGPAPTTQYAYDAAGQRVRKATGQRDRIDFERIYLGAFEIYREYTSEGTVSLERQSLHVLDVGRRLALVETRTQGADRGPEQLLRYQLSNHLESCLLEVDGEARVISREEFHPYGTTSYLAVRRDVETPKRYRYTGKERDAESGLYYHGARYYAPWLGRWISTDPIGASDDINLYGYVRANPVNAGDPTGLFEWNTRNVLIAAAVVTVAVVATVATGGLAGAAIVAVAGELTGGAAIAATVAVGVAGGAAGGAASSVTQQALTNEDHHVDWHQVGHEALVQGVVGGLTAGLGTAVTAARGGVSAVKFGRTAVAAAEASTARRVVAAGAGAVRSAAVGGATSAGTEAVRQVTSGERERNGGFALGPILHEAGVGAAVAGAVHLSVGPAVSRLATKLRPGNPADDLVVDGHDPGGVPAPSPDPVTVYRVEGSGNQRLWIDPQGDVTVKGDQMLFLNFGDEARANDFLAKRLAQGHGDTVIKSFDVPRSYANDIASRAVPESMGRGAPVLSVDTTKTTTSFGLRPSEFPALTNAIIPRSGR